ncbi:MAG TPA: DUF5946 family protein [Isosphaeraceae bacterium]|jgi:hypothetical protein|nr:DUF5946 family protein [Isosphaeraceae bacterium]
MSSRCPECGAPIPEGGSCRDNFHLLLLLEGEIAGVAGSILHFYAVATYGLQHPGSMNYTAEALSGLRSTMADALDGRVTVDDIRRRGRRATNGPQRVTRREGDAVVSRHRGGWPMTVADVCNPETYGSYDTYEAYAELVVRWARSVRETLDADRQQPEAEPTRSVIKPARRLPGETPG